MKRHTEPRVHCIGCMRDIDTLPGSKCPTCMIKETKQHAAQRLAGQMPPKGFSV
jgi:predicted amidophosphoribosyltransferase